MTDSVSQISSTPKVRDAPSHLEDSFSNRPMLEISEELNTISNPVFEEGVPESLTSSLYRTEKIPGLFTLCHVNQIVAKARIIKALELAYSYLCRSKLKQSAELTRSTLKKPRVHEVILLLKGLFEEFRILHDYTEVIMVSPKPEVLTSIGKKLSNLREEAWDYLVDNGLAVPKLPLWGKNNNSEEWWNTNDF